MGVQEVLVEWRFRSNLLTLAVKLADMFFGPTMHVLSRFAIVASTLKVSGDIRRSSSPQAEQARDSISHSISPAVDLVSWILPRFAFCICALVSIERIGIDQRSFQSFASSFDNLYRKLFSSSSPHLSLLLLHEFLQLRPRGWRDEDARLPKIPKPISLLPPLFHPAGRFSPAFGAVHWSHSVFFSLQDFPIPLET